MASGNFNLTTWYAKRIIGDSAASTAANALLQTGTGVTGDTWILSRTDRTTEYGIKYIYDATNAQDKIAFIGGNPSAVKASIQLATGSAILKGHLYLTGTAGAVADTTSQIQFTNADASTTYLCISANTSSTLTLRKATGNATGQIVFRISGISQFTHDGNATACSSTSAGALFVAGGAAIAKKLYIGGGMSVTGTATIYKMESAGDHSSQWRTGRDNAIFSMSLASGKYYPMLSAQTADGTWEMGTYDSTSYANRLLFNYVSNTNYNNNNNTATTISFLSTGELWVGHERTDLSSDHKIGIVNGSGEIYMFSSVTATNTRGIYIPAHGSGSAKNIIVADTNNNVTYTGGTFANSISVNGTAAFSNSITINGTSGNGRQVNVRHTDTGLQVGLIVSSNNYLHGVYSWGYYDIDATTPTFVSSERYLINRNQKGEVVINGCAITNTFDIRNSAATPTIGFRSSNGIQARGGELYLNMTSTTGGVYRADRFYFKVYAYSSTSGQTLSNYDLYRLPAARTNRTSDQTYEIRTSRDNNYGVYYPTGFGSRGSAIGAGDTSVGNFITSWISTTYGQVNFTGNDPITPSTTSPGKVSIRLGGRFYGNDGNSPAMLMNKVGIASATASMIWGMGTPDGESTGINWIRTTSEGIVPYEAGAAGSGHSSLGASDWYFNSAFIDNIKGTLFGSVKNITSLTKGTLPDSTRYQNLWTNFETGADTTNTGTQRIGGHIASWVDTAGITGLTLRAYRYANGTDAHNTLSIEIKADGTCSTNSNSNFIVRKTGDTYIEARSDTTGCRIEVDTQDSGKHGLWSSGYYNGSYHGSSCWILYRDTDSYAHCATRLYGAVWNDYAEFRRGQMSGLKPGQVVTENGDGTMRLATKRLQKGCKVLSDTYGFALGETEEYKIPIAVSGRVLVYCDTPNDELEPGDCLCANITGNAVKMTREEIIKYPDRIIGTVSEIPTYSIWHAGDQTNEGGAKEEVNVDGRIWIYVR